MRAIVEFMTIGNLGKALASQALETTKASVIDAVMSDPKKPEASKPGEMKPVLAPAIDTGSAIVQQVQAMQRPLKDDQELAVLVRAGDEMLRVSEIFVPTSDVLVFSGVDPQGAVTRLVTAGTTAQVVCKVLKVAPGAAALRVGVFTPRPQPKPGA